MKRGAADVAALDSEAVRERVRARLQLVEDGDYFSILGVARDATGYDLRRAFLELRREFDPSRLLSVEVADLAEDVRTVTTVLEEAYEILKDPARRERYRRAIEGAP
jgi:DnaJ-class molecular chaperone